MTSRHARPHALAAVGACVVLLACGSKTATPHTSGAPAARATALHAPSCSADVDWTAEHNLRDAWRVFLLANKPAYVTSDADHRHVIVRDIETNAELADIVAPAPDNMTVLASTIVVTPSGPVMFVVGTPPPKDDDDLSPATNYWLVSFDSQGKAMAPKPVALPPSDGLMTEMTAVGDHLVVLLADLRDPTAELDAPHRAADNHIAIVDRDGRVVKQRDDKGVVTVFPIGERAFAAIVEDKAGISRGLRVFDLARMDWVGPVMETDLQLQDGVFLGGRGVVIGNAWPKGATTRDESFAVELATLTTDGTLSAWKTLDLDAFQVSVLRDVDPDIGLLLTMHGDDNVHMQITAFDGALEVAPSANKVTPPPPGVGVSSLATRDAIYIASWGRIERFRCTRD